MDVASGRLKVGFMANLERERGCGMRQGSHRSRKSGT
jgi:hypothetical protein